MSLLAITLGNTNLRYLLVEGEETLGRGVLPLAGGAPPGPALAALAGSATGADVAIASVHPSALAAVEASLRAVGASPGVAGRDFAVPIANRCRDPGAVGVDRLLGVLAATRLFPGEGVAVVDFGTALTVNIGSPAGEFLGGAIGIGAGTAARALAAAAPRLPEVPLGGPEPSGDPLPGDTTTALRRGLLWQSAGGVERILAEFRRRLPWPLRAVATGGDAGAIVASVPAIERVEPDLALRGLVEARRAAPGAPR